MMPAWPKLPLYAEGVSALSPTVDARNEGALSSGAVPAPSVTQ